MTHGKMDAIRGDDTVVEEQLALAPGFILLSERLVELPTHFGLFRNQISEDGSGVLIPHLPMHKQGTCQTTGFAHKACDAPFPPLAWHRCPPSDPVKGLFAHQAGFDSQVDAEERMPATGANRLK